MSDQDAKLSQMIGKLTTNDLQILEALHNQVERMGLPGSFPMSPVENQLANAILVLLNVLIGERRSELDKIARR